MIDKECGSGGRAGIQRATRVTSDRFPTELKRRGESERGVVRYKVEETRQGKERVGVDTVRAGTDVYGMRYGRG
jgi:hypothetical protein